MKTRNSRWLLGAITAVFCAVLIAKDIVLYANPNITTATDPIAREIHAQFLFDDYIMRGGTYNSGTDAIFVRYSDFLEEMFSAVLVEGRVEVRRTGVFGWWSVPWIDAYRPSFGGQCPVGGSTAQETGYWQSWEVCVAGSCNTGSTWHHTGWKIYPEGSPPAECGVL